MRVEYSQLNVRLITKKEKMSKKINVDKLITGSIITVSLVMVTWLIGGFPFKNIQKGHVGVKTRFERVVEGHLNPGLQVKFPIVDSIIEVNIQQDNAMEHSEAASNDLQRVSTDVKVLYSLSPELVPRAFDRIGDREAIQRKIISPAIKETFKAVNAQFSAEELIQQRAKVSTEIRDSLRQFISNSCKSNDLDGLIIVDQVAIEDFKFSEQFDNSIEEKVTAEQQALRAKEEKLRTVTEAEAQKEKVRLESEAVALQIENEARAEALKIEMVSIAKAEAIEREAKALKDNPELIKLREVEQWDGKLPVYNTGVIPFLNLKKEGGE